MCTYTGEDRNKNPNSQTTRHPTPFPSAQLKLFQRRLWRVRHRTRFVHLYRVKTERIETLRRYDKKASVPSACPAEASERRRVSFCSATSSCTASARPGSNSSEPFRSQSFPTEPIRTHPNQHFSSRIPATPVYRTKAQNQSNSIQLVITHYNQFQHGYHPKAIEGALKTHQSKHSNDMIRNLIQSSLFAPGRGPGEVRRPRYDSARSDCAHPPATLNCRRRHEENSPGSCPELSGSLVIEMEQERM